MKQLSERYELTWFVIEPRDRWYRAVCRFIPNLFDFAVTIRVIRIQPTNMADLASRIRVVRGQVIVSWALGERNATTDWADAFDGIAQIRGEAPAAYQVASVSSHRSPEWFFAAQQAGIASFLESIEQLPQLSGPLQKRFASTSYRVSSSIRD